MLRGNESSSVVIRKVVVTSSTTSRNVGQVQEDVHMSNKKGRESVESRAFAQVELTVIERP